MTKFCAHFVEIFEIFDQNFSEKFLADYKRIAETIGCFSEFSKKKKK